LSTIHTRHCFYCGKALSRRRATKDHVIPRSKGGNDSKQNVVSACHACNQDKGCLTVQEFKMVMALRKGVIKPPKGFKFPGEFED